MALRLQNHPPVARGPVQILAFLPRAAVRVPRRHLAAISLLAFLAACGGGNGGGPDSGASGNANTGTTGTDPTGTGTPGTGTTNPGTTSPGTTASTVDQALASGNPQGTTLAALLQSTQGLLAAQTSAYAGVKQSLFGLDASGAANSSSLTGLTWNPSHDSSSFTVLDRARVQVVLPSNWRYADNTAGQQVALGVVGTAAVSGTRFAAFGGNPIGVPGNSAMDSLLANTVAWLTPRAGQGGFKVVVAHLPGTETYWFPHEAKVRSWFNSRYAGVTINGKPGADKAQADDTCDGAALDACLQGAHLLVIGREQGPAAYDGAVVMKAVADAQARGIPVLYLHHYRDTNDLADRLLAHFGLGQVNNYWSIEGLQAWNPSTLSKVPTQLAGLGELLNRLEQGSFSTRWSGCTTSGRIDCSNDAAYTSEFGTLADGLRSTFRQLDATGTAIFDQSGHALEKRLVLLGDKFRESVSYPLDKSANQQDFFRALFSDVTAYVHRPYGSVAKNLGNFSGTFPAGTPTVSRTVDVSLPTSGSKEYLTGLYVMPGRSVTLTRTDSSAAPVSFGLNMLRDTTWLFNTVNAQGAGGLDRPTQISSPRMPLASGQSVTITSPHGGPLLLFVGAASGGAQAVSVKVSGVITHPVLRDATDAAQVATFQAEVANTPTNWVAVTSDTLTLHSTLAHFRESMKSYANDMARLGADTWTYTIQDTYELAGFNAASGRLNLSASVKAYCAAKGWDCTGPQHRRDEMQHVISDVHAACGDGCSGNPYDQDWAFGPLGWGESHEIGHNLQRSRLKIYGGLSGEVSNNIFPMHKQMHYNTAMPSAQPIVARAGAVKTVFNIMMNAQASANPSAAVTTAIWTDPSYAANNSERVTFYRQLVEYARHYNANLGDGWALITLMHLLDRNIDANASRWASVAAAYGMGTYASAPTGMNGNDFMLIASSYIIGRDMRPMFELWGISVSAAASGQVAAYGLPAAQKMVFPMSDLARPTGLVGAPVVIANGASYPGGY